MKIKKISTRLLIVFVLILMCFVLVACGDEEPTTYTPDIFGYFGYNGNFLTTFKTKNILLDQARQIVKEQDIRDTTINNVPLNMLLSAPGENETDPFYRPEVPTKLKNALTTKYGSIDITTLYYEEGSEEKKSKSDNVVGLDFVNMIVKNEFSSYSQLCARGLIIYDELLDFMNDENIKFVQSGIVAPFTNIFSFHVNDKNQLVVQTRDFREIPSSVGGGIACNFRQDTEVLYDTENKITKWQTSLGVYSATPTGTVKQGYILEMNFKWNLKTDSIESV